MHKPDFRYTWGLNFLSDKFLVGRSFPQTEDLKPIVSHFSLHVAPCSRDLHFVLNNCLIFAGKHFYCLKIMFDLSIAHTHAGTQPLHYSVYSAIFPINIFNIQNVQQPVVIICHRWYCRTKSLHIYKIMTRFSFRKWKLAVLLHPAHLQISSLLGAHLHDNYGKYPHKEKYILHAWWKCYCLLIICVMFVNHQNIIQSIHDLCQFLQIFQCFLGENTGNSYTRELRNIYTLHIRNTTTIS